MARHKTRLYTESLLYSPFLSIDTLTPKTSNEPNIICTCPFFVRQHLGPGVHLLTPNVERE
jgi:hypothetical protein